MLKLITPPAAEPLTLTEVKAHLGITGTEQDAALALYLTAVRETTEKFSAGRSCHKSGNKQSMNSQRLKSNCRKCQCGKLSKSPMTMPMAIRRRMDETSYYLDNISEPSWLFPTADEWGSVSTLDAVNAVRVRFVAGYADLEDEDSRCTSGRPSADQAGAFTDARAYLFTVIAKPVPAA